MDVEALIGEHLRRHPAFGAEDLAKLLYQGVMGMDHLLADRDRFLAELRREWEALDPVLLPREVLLEPVHPTAPIARLNLRPVKAAGVSVDDLGPLLVDQLPKRGDPAELRALWAEVVALAQTGRIPFSADDLERLGATLAAGGPPPGHSRQYRDLNRPAYRLVHDVTAPAFRDALARAGLVPRLR